eukprot:GHUV01001396.1.p1 GENE.GHUV01001396.1~~GHUV01001396.1.p1  ORF type:complete len:538 (+),score=186.29 GHUV01001396.1:251-1864(+)
MSLMPSNHMGFLPSMHEQGVVPPAHTPAVVTGLAVDVSAPPQQLSAGSISPPASSCSTGTALGSVPSRSSPATSSDITTRHQQPRMGVASMAPGSSSVGYNHSREWLYKLVTFPAYFTPCITCCSGSRTPKREQLMTLFDTKYPHKVYCSHCPECQVQGVSSLLQVRRASFKDVVKATDICRFGADISGVQQYTLNGSKVIYLNREQTTEKKNNNGAAAPAMCTVDGRAMMDKSSLYCSLKCKMQAEDSGFTCWLDQQDPSVRILADIAANAPPRPTVACKRSAQPTSSGSSASLGESGGSITGRAKKAARTTSSGGTVGAAAGAPAAQGSGDESAAPATALKAPSRIRLPAQAGLQRAASAPTAATAGAVTAGAPAGLKPIRTSVNPSPSRSSNPLGFGTGQAPSAFLEAAMSEPQLGPSTSLTMQQPVPAAGVSGSSWLAGPADLDHALSCSDAHLAGSWDSWATWEAGSPCFGSGLGVNDTTWEDGSLSPALITAPNAAAGGMLGQCLSSSPEEWWLGCNSPSGAFAAAGLAGF